MKPLCVTFILLVLTWVSHAQANADHTESIKQFAGRWKFVSEKSFKDAPDRKNYTEYEITIEEIDGKLRIKREYVYHSIKYTREIEVFLDGRGESNQLPESNGRTITAISRTKLRNRSIVREYSFESSRKSMSPDGVETFKIGKDGNTLEVKTRHRFRPTNPQMESLLNRYAVDQIVMERIR